MTFLNSKEGHSPVVVVNLTGLTSGGGRTYVLGLVDAVCQRRRDQVQWRLLVTPSQMNLMSAATDSRPDVDVRVLPSRGPVRRVLWEQMLLPRSELVPSASTLVGAGNFGRGAGRVRCVVVAHNALHFVDAGLGGRLGLRLRLESALARNNVRGADVTVVPSKFMATLVSRTGALPVVGPLGPGAATKLAPPRDGSFVFVHRTTWGPHKRLNVLLEAVRILAQQRSGQFRVESACDPLSAFARRWPQSRRDAILLDDPLVKSHFVCRSYSATEQQTIQGHAAVVPSDLESFCFPLAEAIGLEMPAVAADVAFARELCGEAAFYFTPGDPSALAHQMARILDGARPAKAQREWRDRISWQSHVDTLVSACVRSEPRSSK